ncbi:MAG: hypothetical protein RMK31_08870 [Candidatus Caldarchaeum sp.]|nr:hypothetical protein [Candidatus Caldarchaeum sp.]
MVGGYMVAEAIIVIAVVLTASAFTSNMFNVLTDMEQSSREKINMMKKEVQARLEPVFLYVSENRSHIYFWVKNVGPSKISHAEIELSEIFILGREVFENPRYGREPPCWSYELVRDVYPDNGWSWGETLKITIKLQTPLRNGEYLIRLATPFTKTDHVFSVGM